MPPSERHLFIISATKLIIALPTACVVYQLKVKKSARVRANMREEQGFRLQFSLENYKPKSVEARPTLSGSTNEHERSRFAKGGRVVPKSRFELVNEPNLHLLPQFHSLSFRVN